MYVYILNIYVCVCNTLCICTYNNILTTSMRIMIPLVRSLLQTDVLVLLRVITFYL